MSYAGHCRCGAISWHAEGEPAHASLCHCAECTRSAGAYVVGWALFPQAAVTITGSPQDYESSPGTIRQFCGTCGTGLFYRNESIFPGQVDIQTATLDDPAALPPQARIQVADAPGWFEHFDALPTFARFPEA
ncbi:GFA family protein [Sphingomonas sp. KR1UV-12]|uniref:GFA family protein n=1 Tax=Sphingomonas aurea TaxID=3063994 RepID=A0ABT9EHV0_9SPHN|nr:GFA family protein [Sphingomonas sp. KR1UV-12]MDP1026541.1 GFA family protein [Sphingomonas sp. KR1UV-12]